MIWRFIGQLVERLFTETQEKVPDKVRRPPRWEWLTREVIRGNGSGQESPMLTRYRLLKTPRGSLFVHHWHRPDSDLDCHDHPWWFGTLVLRGGYTEELRHLPGDPASWSVQRHRGWLSWHTMPLNQAHRVIAIRPSTWTLLLVGPKAQDWSFYLHRRRQVVAGRALRPEELGVVLPPGDEWGLHLVPNEPWKVPWQAYIAAGGNPDPFNC